MFDGRHEAIIPEEAWDALQARMQGEAARKRRGRPRGSGKVQRSGLIGKLFDETGDRLTPSHSKSKTGTRLRYYISHRLIAKSGEGVTDGWRLPASELESVIADLIRAHLDRPGALLKIVPDCTAGEVGVLQDRLRERLSAASSDPLLQLASRVDLAPGSIQITMNAARLAEMLEIEAGRIGADLPTIQAPFRLRKRGVETKLVVSGAARPVDETLLRNIAQAYAWFEMITAGQSYVEIAETAGTSKRRVQQVVDLAFLAPDIVRDVMAGRQPVGFTSDWALRHDLPSDWAEQRRLLATL